MYRCQKCNCVVQPNRPANKIVAETRAAHYSPRTAANPAGGGRKGRSKHDPGGAGTEIVREILVCESCADSLQDSSLA